MRGKVMCSRVFNAGMVPAWQGDFYEKRRATWVSRKIK